MNIFFISFLFLFYIFPHFFPCSDLYLIFPLCIESELWFFHSIRSRTFPTCGLANRRRRLRTFLLFPEPTSFLRIRFASISPRRKQRGSSNFFFLQSTPFFVRTWNRPWWGKKKLDSRADQIWGWKEQKKKNEKWWKLEKLKFTHWISWKMMYVILFDLSLNPFNIFRWFTAGRFWAKSSKMFPMGFASSTRWSTRPRRNCSGTNLPCGVGKRPRESNRTHLSCPSID